METEKIQTVKEHASILKTYLKVAWQQADLLYLLEPTNTGETLLYKETLKYLQGNIATSAQYIKNLPLE